MMSTSGELNQLESAHEAASEPSEPTLSDAAGVHGASENAEASEARDAGEVSELGEVGSGGLNRRRIEEQLEALKRKEAALRRALAVADHPELADAVRLLEGRAFAIARVEAKLAEPLSKAEERRRETLDKKLASLREKRAELDAQIAGLESELAALGEERTRAFEAERRAALQELLVTLSTHESALRAAGLDAKVLVPELERWMPEVIALAESLVVERAAQKCVVDPSPTKSASIV